MLSNRRLPGHGAVAACVLFGWPGTQTAGREPTTHANTGPGPRTCSSGRKLT